jgi:hypothetical protein
MSRASSACGCSSRTSWSSSVITPPFVDFASEPVIPEPPRLGVNAL